MKSTGVAWLFLPRSLGERAALRSGGISFRSIAQASTVLFNPPASFASSCQLSSPKNNPHTSQLFHSPFLARKINSPHSSHKKFHKSRQLFKNPFLNSKITLVEILCKLCERSQTIALTFPLPPALEWATIPRCHFPVLRGPAIPKRTRTVCRGELLALPRARTRRLKKDELGLLSTAFSHLWK
jgi:hypothetical protein